MAKTASKSDKSKTNTKAPAKASARTAAKASGKPPARSAGSAAKAAPAKTAPVKTAPVKTAPAKAAPAKAAPAKAAAAKTAAKAAPAQAAKTASDVKPARPPKTAKRRSGFSVSDYVVYPTHGVGRITSLEEQEVAGLRLELFVIDFDKEKMTLRVPVAKAESSGMRQLSSPDKMRSALATLKGRARVKRTMWSRRAQEYEAKINSGDPVSIAEVVRDLHRAAGQPEQSYSERQIYEAALDRLARELAAVEGLNEDQATERLEKMLHAA